MTILIPRVKLYFDSKHNVWPCKIENKNSHTRVISPECAYISPTYTQVYRGEEYVAKRMYFIYQKNPGYLGGLAGYHQGDEEGLTFLYDKHTFVLRFVVFSVHGAKEAIVKRVEDCTFQDESLIAFVALESNATYPTCGTHWRVWGVANDTTSAHVVWEVGPILEITNEILPLFKFPPKLVDKQLSCWQRICRFK